MRVGKKSWRRYLSLVLSLCILCSCIGCGDDGQNGDDSALTSTITDDERAQDTPNNPEIKSENLVTPLPPVNIIEQYNVVFVLDTSASMSKSDPDEKAFNSACMFLNSLYVGAEGKNQPGIPDISVGIVAYNDTSTVVSSLAPIVSETSLYTIESDIFSLSAFKGSDSGLGRAILDAATMLSQTNRALSSPGFPPGSPFAENAQKNMIVLFTDGFTDFQASESNAPSSITSPQVPTQQPVQRRLPDFGEQVRNDLTTGLNLAIQSQAEIFVVGLDVNDEFDASWPEFRCIANYTQQAGMGGPPPMPPQHGGHAAPSGSSGRVYVPGAAAAGYRG